MKGLTRALAVAVVSLVFLGACHRGGGNATTLSPSQLVQAANQQLCGVESNVLGVVSEVSKGTVSSTSDVVTKLGQLQGQLQGAAHSFQKHGFSDQSSKITALSTAVGKLKSAVSGGNTAAIVTAATVVATAISALPTCPGATPSA